MSQPEAPITLATPPAFSPPLYAILVNSRLFFSVICSLTSAALAMLLQEWVYRYRMVTRQPNFTPAKRARVRETFSNFASGRHSLGNLLYDPPHTHFHLLLSPRFTDFRPQHQPCCLRSSVSVVRVCPITRCILHGGVDF